VVDSACSFLQELSFPEIVEVGVAIGKLEIHHLDMSWRSLNKVSTSRSSRAFCPCLCRSRKSKKYRYSRTDAGCFKPLFTVISDRRNKHAATLS
jgi:hypothetical protein